MVFASRIVHANHIEPMAELIDHACGQLVGMDVNLAQTLLDPGESLNRQMFQAGGFNDLAVLSYLERTVRSPRGVATPPPQWSGHIMASRYDDSMRAELLDVLDRSYEETLDCPGLQGYRRTEDILEGHRASGTFDPSLWTILRIDNVASGVLLLNPSADHQTIELVYLGLAKSARGQGLGTQLLRHGLRMIEQRSERMINLAVDEANAPAIALYTREGFRSALRRAAMIRPLAQRALAK
jgi:ribosomal protein S18 acetylase RimI-like enzyme